METNKPLPIELEIKEKYLKKFKEDIVQQQQVKANDVIEIFKSFSDKIKFLKKESISIGFIRN